MRRGFLFFCEIEIKNFAEAYANFVLFLPYFFSLKSLIQTLFNPWKNILEKKATSGFDFGELFQRTMANLISRSMGFAMRTSMILFFLITIALSFFLGPFLFVFFTLLLPLLYIKSLFEQSEEAKIDALRLQFVGTHLLKQENYPYVLSWFQKYYLKMLAHEKWWKFSHLLSIPPLARDWAMGYTVVLDQYGEDLTSGGYQLKTQNIVNRNSEINEIERILSKVQEASVLIVGEEGVGKHTIVDALAKKLYEGRTKTELMYKRILKLNLEKILTQFSDQKQRESFIEDLFKEAMNAKNVIIFIDNFDRYVGYGEARVDLTIPIEKYTRNGALQIIGITTPFFYQKFIFPNDKLQRIFTKVNVYEISPQEAQTMLLEIVPLLEARHTVTISYEAVTNTIEKSEYYITYIPFPEKAIDLLDSACVLAKQKAEKEKIAIVMPEQVDTVLTEKTHVPTTLTEDLKDKLTHLEQLLLSTIIHQEYAISKISSGLRRSFVLIGKRKKPIASFLFLGPTGVGKTESAKAVSRVIFGSNARLIRFDMSLYQIKEALGELLGSQMTNNPGLLSEAIREKPYGVLLLDEIEKAHRDLINIFLTVLDEGYFTDGFGKRVDCKNLIIIATSNAASDFIYKQIGSGSNFKNDKVLLDYLVEHKIFSPEFLNRFDAVIGYNPLDTGSAVIVAKKFIDQIASDVYKLHKIKLVVPQERLLELAKTGYNEKFGARDMERLLRTQVEDKVAKMILENKVKEGETINL